jgi:sialate O-acetylesterase|tara:strand:- start:14823 stop:15047 length:225 start_codon:yes stop_codon:yes gene_type:complete
VEYCFWCLVSILRNPKFKITGRKRVLVNSEKGTTPVDVKYACENWIKGTLFDTNLLPASSLRTYDWEESTQNLD